MLDCSEGNISISNVTCLYDVPQEQEIIYCIIQQFLGVYGLLVVCGIGLFFNSITILLFFDKTLSCVLFNRLLLCLAIMDNIYLLVTTLEVWTFDKDFYHDYTFFFIIYPARNISMCCTIYMTVILALERYNAVR